MQCYVISDCKITFQLKYYGNAVYQKSRDVAKSILSRKVGTIIALKSICVHSVNTNFVKHFTNNESNGRKLNVEVGDNKHIT